MKPIIKKIQLTPNKTLVIVKMKRSKKEREQVVVFYSLDGKHYIRLLDTDLMRGV